MINLCIFRSDIYIPHNWINNGNEQQSLRQIIVNLFSKIWRKKLKLQIIISQTTYNEHIAFEVAFFTFTVFAISNSFNDYNSNGYLNISSIFLISISLLFGVIIISKFEKFRMSLMRKYVINRLKYQKIAVLDGRIHELMSHTIPITRFSPRIWKKQLEEYHLEVDLISASRITNEYSMIINPFGGLYIEQDFSNLKTFMKIKKYILDGGVFINVKDLAFWKSWDSRNKTEGVTSPGVATYGLHTGERTIERRDEKR